MSEENKTFSSRPKRGVVYTTRHVTIPVSISDPQFGAMQAAMEEIAKRMTDVLEDCKNCGLIPVKVEYVNIQDAVNNWGDMVSMRITAD